MKDLLDSPTKGQGCLPTHTTFSENTISKHFTILRLWCRCFNRQQIVHFVSYALTFTLLIVTLVTFFLVTYYIVEEGKRNYLFSISLVHGCLAIVDIIFTIFVIILDNYFDHVTPHYHGFLSQKVQPPSWMLDDFYREITVPFWYKQFCILLSLPSFIQGFLSILLAYLIYTLRSDQKSYYRQFFLEKNSVLLHSFTNNPSNLAKTSFIDFTDNLFNGHLNKEFDEYHNLYLHGAANCSLTDTLLDFHESSANITPTLQGNTTEYPHIFVEDDTFYYKNTQRTTACPSGQSESRRYLKDRRRSTTFGSPFIKECFDSLSTRNSVFDFIDTSSEHRDSLTNSPINIDVVVHRG
ncbi:uncharacterized protein LOC128884169 isoform X2 [Hylaeus volcanicus]|uniref:uncharacterized protein LOC128884169 isoform X2 n=1 Tax=Hylaeus volcanicus TaxID=313075 RepID=UPI0023B80A03|nr:uncharacterized protein LOC128884169 isoform X2 [Hylaeus volcanicus]